MLFNAKYESEECNIPCHKCKYLKEEAIVENELKALEIIKKKRVNIISLLSSIEWYNPSHYNDSVGCPIGGELTQEEYDLLKGVLNET